MRLAQPPSTSEASLGRRTHRKLPNDITKEADPRSSPSAAAALCMTPTTGSWLCGQPTARARAASVRAHSLLSNARARRSSWPAPGRGEIRMSQARTQPPCASRARDLSGAARHAAYAAGQAAAVAHVAAHELARQPTRSRPCVRPHRMESKRMPAGLSVSAADNSPMRFARWSGRPAAQKRHCWSVFDC